MNSALPDYPLAYFVPGQNLGKYVIRGLLGRGGMAEVYRALNPDLKHDVAIKVLHPNVVDSDASLARFRKEAQAVASLNHPNIVRVFDFHADDRISFMVMELIDGPTLGQIIKGYPQGMPRDVLLHVFLQLAEAVRYAHDHGVIHRDLKPGNVLLADRSRPILTDFGLARIAGTDRVTASGVASGTPSYMAPEVAFGDEPEIESDIYALGIILYEMLHGDLPFKGDSAVAIMMQHIQMPLPLPASTSNEFDPKIVQVIKKATEKDKRDRYHSVGEMMTDLSGDAAGNKKAVANTIKLPASLVAKVRQPDGGARDTVGDRAAVVITRAVGTMQRNPVLSSGLFLTVAILIVGAIGIGELQRLRLAQPTATAAVESTPVPPAGMAFIPGTTFSMGTTRWGRANEAPPHDVTLAPYFMDITEVTNKDYISYVLAKGAAAPSTWKKPVSVNWKLDATDGFAVGTPDDRFSYDGKVTSSLTGGVHYDVNADTDTGDVIVDITGTLTYQQGKSKSGHWKIVHTSYSNDQDFFQGGIAVDVPMHGDSGQEAPFYPTVQGALATWGTADLYLDDQLFMSDLGIHTMFIKAMRDDQHRILKSKNECCYDPGTSPAGYVNDSKDQVFVLLFTRGLYNPAAPSPEAVWVELYFDTVKVISQPDAASVPTYPVNGSDLPVSGITWLDAASYCEYVGKRLPTEAEWEHAARGPQNFYFPWGNESGSGDGIPANWTGGAPQKVGSVQGGKNAYGLVDMSGNVWEWVNDWYQPDYYKTSPVSNPTGPSNAFERVIRGGGFAQMDPTGPAEYTATFRTGLSPDTTDPAVGFRCAKDAP